MIYIYMYINMTASYESFAILSCSICVRTCICMFFWNPTGAAKPGRCFRSPSKLTYCFCAVVSLAQPQIACHVCLCFFLTLLMLQQPRESRQDEKTATFAFSWQVQLQFGLLLRGRLSRSALSAHADAAWTQAIVVRTHLTNSCRHILVADTGKMLVRLAHLAVHDRDFANLLSAGCQSFAPKPVY